MACVTEIVDDLEVRIRSVVGPGQVVLHEPRFDARDIGLVTQTVQSSFVSSVGDAITQFECQLSEITGAAHVIAVTSGTAALQLAVTVAGVPGGSEVLVPAMTFAATANAVVHAGGVPHFIDSEPMDFGVNCDYLETYLNEIGVWRSGKFINRVTGRHISAIVPVHVFGRITNMERFMALTGSFGLTVIEDAAEALGSWRHGTHAGLFGAAGVLSFNGNKIVTTGGGGAILTNDDAFAIKARHLATTAKTPHPFEFLHDTVGYNFRMPAINAALGLGQLQRFSEITRAKAVLASRFGVAFADCAWAQFLPTLGDQTSNAWLNAIKLNDQYAYARDEILTQLIDRGLGCRPIWKLLSDLPHFGMSPRMELSVAPALQRQVINLPSSPFLSEVTDG